MKKRRLTILGSLFALCACGSSTPVGKYEFMLGSTEANKVGVTVTLSNEDFVKETEVKGKKFNGKLIIPSTQLAEKFSFNGDPETNQFFQDTINGFIQDGISGYYNIIKDEASSTKYGNRLSLGAHIKIEDTNGIDIPPEVLEYVLVSYCDNYNVTLQLPVSVKDVQHQLAWYGIYFNLDAAEPTLSILDKDKLPGSKHGEGRFGTHPVVETDKQTGEITKNEVNEMNIAFASDFSNTFVYKSLTDTTIIGKIYNISDYYFFSPAKDYTVTSATFTCAMNFQNKYGSYDQLTETTLIVDSSLENKIVEVSTAGGKIETKDYGTNFYQQPFVFRDFHDIKLGLAKVNK